jgi:DNA invertase Pin-like site-specific DNA recombinase
MSLAFSYLRFSSREQARGDSIRRQTEATADWCRRNGVTLDTSLSLRDEGVSAFRGKNRENPDVHGLAAFLSAVKSGRVPDGSVLVLENLDRLTRESIVPAVNLFTGLLLAGIRVVQLRPTEQTFTAGADMTSIMLALVELSRGHSESAMKSQRIGAVWAQKRKHAGEKVVTRRLPAWVVCTDGKLGLDPVKAAAVRRVYAMARDGMGSATIAQTLNAEQVPVIGRTGYKGRAVLWSESVVLNILRSRAVIGEYQPHVGRGSDRRPIGEPLQGYYPRLMSDDEWHATQSTIKGRAKVGRGRRGRHVNLFAGLLRDARDGGSMYYFRPGRGKPTIVPVGAKYGRGSLWSSFPAGAFDSAVLSMLAEVTAAAVGGNDESGRMVEALAGRVAELDTLIRQWAAKMDDPNTVDIVAAKLAEFNGKRKVLAEELAEAQREAASPLAETWGEFRSLADMMKADPSDELRVKVRAALRRSIDSVHCLFVGTARVRVAAVQVWFRGEAHHRDYLLRHSYTNGKADGRNKWSGRTEVLSFADAEAGPLDLRKRTDVAKVLKVLRSLETAQPAETQPIERRPGKFPNTPEVRAARKVLRDIAKGKKR